MTNDDAPPPQTRQGRLLRRLLALFGVMPLWLGRALGRLLGWLAWIFPNRTRRVALRNIELCFPELDAPARRRLVRDSLRQMGLGFMELPLMWTRDREQTLSRIESVRGLEYLREGLDSGRGVLLAAPHLGSWEILVQYLSGQGPCTFLYREPRDPGVERVVTEGRERLGAEMVRAGASGVRALFKALKAGRIVGVMPDQQPKRGQGEFAPFFGIQAFTMVLYSKMARRTDAPLILGWAERLKGGRAYRVHFVPADPAVRDPDLNTSVAALNAQVESLVRQCPQQYQWGYKRFSMRPEGEAGASASDGAALY